MREERAHIFEVGKVFVPSGAELPDEPTRVGVLLSGRWDQDSWLRTGAAVDYFLAKGLVERIAAGLHSPAVFSRPDSDGGSTEPFLHPGKSAVVSTLGGRPAGWIGEVHPLVAQAYDLRGVVVAAELDLDALIEGSTDVLMFRDLLAFPVVEQDFALVVDAAVPAAAVVSSLQAAGGTLLEDIRVFDLYEGAQVAAGKKSLALRLSFRRPIARSAKTRSTACAGRCSRRSRPSWGRNSGLSRLLGGRSLGGAATCMRAGGMQTLALLCTSVYIHALVGNVRKV